MQYFKYRGNLQNNKTLIYQLTSFVKSTNGNEQKLGGGYTGVYICQEEVSCMLKMHVLYYMEIIPQ